MVDYSLFIMETVEMSMEKVEASPVGLRQSFPPLIYRSRSLFRCFSVFSRLLTIYVGGYFYSRF